MLEFICMYFSHETIYAFPKCQLPVYFAICLLFWGLHFGQLQNKHFSPLASVHGRVPVHV